MKRNPYYADRFAPDGGIANEWRYVKAGGKVKFGGTYYYAPRLAEIVGEFVRVSMNCYWCTEVLIFRGAVGCTQWYCKATPQEKC